MALFCSSEALADHERQGYDDYDGKVIAEQSSEVISPLHLFDEAGQPLASKPSGPFVIPRWQMSPVLELSMANENLLENPELSDIVMSCIEHRAAVLGGFHRAERGWASDTHHTTAYFAGLASIAARKKVKYLGDPMSHMIIPIFDSKNDNGEGEVVGIMQVTIHWLDYLQAVLPKGDFGYRVVIENTCDPVGENAYTFQVDGNVAIPVGLGNHHEPRFREYTQYGYFDKKNIQDGTPRGLRFYQRSCEYEFLVYPTQDHYTSIVTNLPVYVTLAVSAIFLFSILVFLLYDRLVEHRQNIVLAQATQSTAIVSSLFVSNTRKTQPFTLTLIFADGILLVSRFLNQPKQVRDRLLAVHTEPSATERGDMMFNSHRRLKSFLSGTSEHGSMPDEPIADLFPECTVLFADIAGFTAWSSAREPAQFFILLQTVYQNFDYIAKRRRVFKVETIGDSYVAVTGLPEAQPKHASIMVRFAWDCLNRIGVVTKELESTLGPDTATLAMRFGLHSGPVTAGVLKGDRARFQLFGDTVNTASRMESTGMRGRIQVSAATADALRKQNKESWLTPRSDNVSAKGKGVMNTYWVVLKKGGSSGGASSEDEGTFRRFSGSHRRLSTDDRSMDQKEARLVGWVSEILLQQIKKVVAVHERCPLSGQSSPCEPILPTTLSQSEGTICLDEIQDTIHTPDFRTDVADATLDSSSIQVPIHIIELLRDYVSIIAVGYRRNKFHNFEHACHVTMCVAKLLGRIVTPDLSSMSASSPFEASTADVHGRNEIAAQIHDSTYGLTSDPLATFALVFTGLIHDVDHQGVSNLQLAKEQPELAQHYRHKSLAEQHSFDISWDVFMADRFKTLRD